MSRASQAEPGLDTYVRSIQRHCLLSRHDESQLAQRVVAGDHQAADRLVAANLRFVVKIAHEYQGYGLKILDLIQEGNMGLVMAVRKFEPERGFRLVSYAVWWIRAYIQNFVMRQWSQVKLGTTQAQRKLFFKLRSTREAADRRAPSGMRASDAEIAATLGVKEREVAEMEQRLIGHDLSLDAPVQTEAGRVSHIDALADPASHADEQLNLLVSRQKRRKIGAELARALRVLNAKERYIVQERLMSDTPRTLQDVGSHFGISRERARQIEGNVRRKMRILLSQAGLAPAAA